MKKDELLKEAIECLETLSNRLQNKQDYADLATEAQTVADRLKTVLIEEGRDEKLPKSTQAEWLVHAYRLIELIYNILQN